MKTLGMLLALILMLIGCGREASVHPEAAKCGYQVFYDDAKIYSWSDVPGVDVYKMDEWPRRLIGTAGQAHKMEGGYYQLFGGHYGTKDCHFKVASTARMQ